MSTKHHRKPISNFFIKKELQLRFIKRVIYAAILSTIVCVATLLFTYVLTYNSTVFYQVNLDGGASIGDRANIISIIFPSLIISTFINIIIAIAIGLYASRKYAVPIFKLEQWARLLCDGHLTAQLHFREKEEMKELCDYCNNATGSIRRKIIRIRETLPMLTDVSSDQKEEKCKTVVMQINAILKEIDLKSDNMGIHTIHDNHEKLTKKNIPK